VLEGEVGLVLAVSGQVDLAVLADDPAVAVDQDGGVEAVGLAVLPAELRVAEVDGISRSKNRSTSAWSSMYQRGKKVVSASSGNTTRLAPRSPARRSSAIRRSTTTLRGSSRGMGPSWAAATIGVRFMVVSPLEGV
jgi:hypothetical protein